MKKIIILIGFSISLYFGSNAQISINEPKCVSCKGNEISNISSALGVNNTAGGDASFASGELNATGTSYMNTIRLSDSDIKYIDELQGNDGLKFKGNVQSSTQMILTEDGKLGIGNLTPNALLDVAGDIRFTGQLYDSEGLFEPSKWEENGDNIYYNSGNVGIGTDAPQTLLDVSGTLSVSDAATFGNNLQVNGKIKTTQLQITQNAGTDKILSSDANGNAMWMNMPAVDDGDWFTNSDGDIYHNNSWVGIGTSNPAARFELYGGDMVIGTSAKKFIFHTS